LLLSERGSLLVNLLFLFGKCLDQLRFHDSVLFFQFASVSRYFFSICSYRLRLLIQQRSLRSTDFVCRSGLANVGLGIQEGLLLISVQLEHPEFEAFLVLEQHEATHVVHQFVLGLVELLLNHIIEDRSLVQHGLGRAKLYVLESGEF
jgi:hypothetical protein